jgi:hypothetical protein
MSLINKEKDIWEKDKELVELRGLKVSLEEEFGKFIDKTLNIARDVYEDAFCQVEKGLSLEFPHDVLQDEGGLGFKCYFFCAFLFCNVILRCYV